MPRLHDVVVDHPRILFVGINPGRRSGEIGHHFAGKGNPFWRLLHASGLTPTLLTAEQDARLAEWRFALTNVCPRVTRSAAELTREELERGAGALRRKVRAMQPDVVALVGLSLYKLLFPRATTPGAGEKPERLEGARVFVVPNPSGLNAAFPGFEHKRVWFDRLKAFVDQVSPRTPEAATPGPSGATTRGPPPSGRRRPAGRTPPPPRHRR